MNIKRLTITALAAVAVSAGATWALNTNAGAGSDATARLYTAGGDEIGKVSFEFDDDQTEVKVEIDLAHAAIAVNAFHGFHVHSTGVCAAGGTPVVDFGAAGPHYNPAGALHAQHAGDMPSVFVNSDGTTTTKFTIDRFEPDELFGKAVILHAKPDYWDINTINGNAGARVACGVIG